MNFSHPLWRGVPRYAPQSLVSLVYLWIGGEGLLIRSTDFCLIWFDLSYKSTNRYKDRRNKQKTPLNNCMTSGEMSHRHQVHFHWTPAVFHAVEPFNVFSVWRKFFRFLNWHLFSSSRLYYVVTLEMGGNGANVAHWICLQHTLLSGKLP